MRTLLSVMLIMCFYVSNAQTYKDSIAAFREKYTTELLEDARAPIKASQVGGLNFFSPDKKYRVWATVKETPGSQPFKIPTHSGKLKPYREWGTLTFSIDGEDYVLHMYQGLDLIKEDKYKDYLFIPFRDRTNYERTYAGGRYIDLDIKEIVNGKMLLDFNKCYNPYCAYADGYNCPIPPDENSLPIEIKAGEKLFTSTLH